MFITATITLMVEPSQFSLKLWRLIEDEGQLNERLADLIRIEPGFGVDLVEIEDAEISGEDEE